MYTTGSQSRGGAIHAICGWNGNTRITHRPCHPQLETRADTLTRTHVDTEHQSRGGDITPQASGLTQASGRTPTSFHTIFTPVIKTEGANAQTPATTGVNQPAKVPKDTNCSTHSGNHTPGQHHAIHYSPPLLCLRSVTKEGAEQQLTSPTNGISKRSMDTHVMWYHCGDKVVNQPSTL